jgi:hypothetical protein
LAEEMGFEIHGMVMSKEFLYVSSK